jgi:Ca2+-transporting ATPase
MFWHTKTIAEVMTLLDSSEKGLTDFQVSERFLKYGHNKLPEEKQETILSIFLRQFQSPLIYLLLVAAVIVFVMGDTTESLIIFAVLFINAVIGMVQEGRVQSTLSALKKLSETSATVLRNGREVIIKDEQIVPGDIIILQEGEKVPSDARIVFENSLRVDEASLTGESMPVTKTSKEMKEGNTPISDQRNMVFKGTNILSGSATAIIVSTGINTEIGKIAQKISSIDTEIPLKKNIKYLSQLVIAVVVFISTVLFVAGIFLGKDPKEIFSVVVALSVSVIPEGLPIVMTLILATGVRRMSKSNVLVKRLQAVEALGQTKVIAVDKTGTLTRNEMVIEKVFVGGKLFEVDGKGYEPSGEIVFGGNIIEPLSHSEILLSGKVAVFCANAKLSFLEEEKLWKVTGDPTEAAMLVFSKKVGFSKETIEQEFPKVLEIPFDYKNKYHAVVRKLQEGNFLSVVGAPESVLSKCSKVFENGKYQKLTDEKRKQIEQTFFSMARQGLRVIAFAVNDNLKKIEEGNISDLPDLAFAGFFGMKDALRSEVKDSVEKVRKAGMRVVMITGDHVLTAEAIGREAGIWRQGDTIVTGEEIESLSEDLLIKKLPKTTIFARVTPEHKFRIIEAFKKTGEVVAMTGDGVNDAPSLVAADLGVAMGKIGTEVAKEASDIVLLDDNFEGIVSAAEEGRSIYKTIKKVILYLFSTSMAEIIVIVVAVFSGFPLLFLATQIIWLNFVTDGFLVLALAMESKEKGLINNPFEKPKKWIIDGLMTERMFLMAVVMALGTLYLFKTSLPIDFGQADLLKSQSIALTALAVFQWFNAWNCRSERKSVFAKNPLSNIYLVFATIIVVVLQILALHNGFLQKILHTVPLSLGDWRTVLLVSISIIAVEEIRKGVYNLMHSR